MDHRLGVWVFKALDKNHAASLQLQVLYQTAVCFVSLVTQLQGTSFYAVFTQGQTHTWDDYHTLRSQAKLQHSRQCGWREVTSRRFNVYTVRDYWMHFALSRSWHKKKNPTQCISQCDRGVSVCTFCQIIISDIQFLVQSVTLQLST